MIPGTPIPRNAAGDDVPGDVGDAAAAGHGALAEPFVGVRLGHMTLPDQDRLGAIDGFPLAQFVLGLAQLGAGGLVLAEHRGGGAQDRFHVRRRHAEHVVGRYAGADRFLHERRIVLIHEQHDGAGGVGGDDANALQRVAVGTRHVDEHDVGQQRRDGVGEQFARSLAQDDQAGIGRRGPWSMRRRAPCCRRRGGFS